MNSECRRTAPSEVGSSKALDVNPTSTTAGRIRRALLLVALALPLAITQAAPTVTQIAAGSYHSLFLKSDGSLWTVGYNSEGELGIGSALLSTNLPQLVVSSNVTAVGAGDYHSMFRKSDGSLWVMGYNEYGQLGDGTYTNRYFPELVVSNDVTLFAGGSAQTLFASFHSSAGPGSLWGMGEDGNGELGTGNTVSTNTPQRILSTVSGGPAVTALAAGTRHSLFVRPDGSLWAMGYDFYGQLGDGTNLDQLAPEQIVYSNVTAVVAGAYFSLFTKSNGTLWGMGDDVYGQLGDNSSTPKHSPVPVATNVTAMAAGFWHTLFIKSDGSLWAMGYNAYGQLGDGTTTNRSVPVMIVRSNVVAVAAGSFHSLFLKSDGSVWAMGINTSGQLGDGTVTERHSPVQVLPLVVPQPFLTAVHPSGTNLLLTGGNGQSGRTYYTLASTNVTRPFSQWTPVATNLLSTDGNFSFTATNAVSPAADRRFYILQAH